MKIKFSNTKCEVKSTSSFNKQLKKISKQNFDLDELKEVVVKLANKEVLDAKYRNHKLLNDKYYTDCFECHIRPDWLLVYKYIDDNVVLLLFATGSHSELFSTQ